MLPLIDSLASTEPSAVDWEVVRAAAAISFLASVASRLAQEAKRRSTPIELPRAKLNRSLVAVPGPDEEVCKLCKGSKRVTW